MCMWRVYDYTRATSLAPVDDKYHFNSRNDILVFVRRDARCKWYYYNIVVSSWPAGADLYLATGTVDIAITRRPEKINLALCMYGLVAWHRRRRDSRNYYYYFFITIGPVS